jgi:hypothetical protein
MPQSESAPGKGSPELSVEVEMEKEVAGGRESKSASNLRVKSKLPNN